MDHSLPKPLKVLFSLVLLALVVWWAYTLYTTMQPLLNLVLSENTSNSFEADQTICAALLFIVGIPVLLIFALVFVISA
jgi:hypothetical protein